MLKLNQKCHIVIAVFLFLCSFILRLSLISKGPFHVDCLNLAVNSQNLLDTHQYQNLFGFGYPLTILLGAFFIWFLNLFAEADAVTAVNFMSVLMSAACCPLLYFLGLRLFNRLTAFLSAVTLIFTPIFLGVSVFGKSHAPSVLFMLMGIYFLDLYRSSFSKRNLLISGIAIGCMGAARFQDMILMVPAITFFCFSAGYLHKENKTARFSFQAVFKDSFVFLVTIFIVTLAFHLPYFIDKSTGDSYVTQLDAFFKQGVGDNFLGLFSSQFLYALIILVKAFSEIGLFISLIGFIMLALKKKITFIFFLLWIIPGLFFYGNLGTTVPRFFVFILPPLILAQSYCLAYLIKRNRVFFIVFFIVYGLTLYLSFTPIYPILSFRHKHALLPDYARWVAQTIEPNARLITTDERLFYEYFGNIKVLSRPSFYNFDTKRVQNFKRKLDRILDSNIPVYITSVSLYAYDPERRFSRFILENYQFKFIGIRFYEDWHQGVTKQRVGRTSLMKVNKRIAENRNKTIETVEK